MSNWQAVLLFSRLRVIYGIGVILLSDQVREQAKMLTPFPSDKR